jgi:Mg-chelatase subunit ChlI
VDDAGFRLLIGWLLAAYMPGIPHPILALLGQQGTAKTTALRLLLSLLDPSTAPVRTPPTEPAAWAVTAAHSWAVGLDNVSALPAWLQDALCKAVTGDGIVRRAL